MSYTFIWVLWRLFALFLAHHETSHVSETNSFVEFPWFHIILNGRMCVSHVFMTHHQFPNLMFEWALYVFWDLACVYIVFICFAQTTIRQTRVRKLCSVMSTWSCMLCYDLIPYDSYMFSEKYTCCINAFPTLVFGSVACI